MSAINDPLGQTNSPAGSDHCSHLKVVLFCEILKSGDGRTDGWTSRAKIEITTAVTRGSIWTYKRSQYIIGYTMGIFLALPY